MNLTHNAVLHLGDESQPGSVIIILAAVEMKTYSLDLSITQLGFINCIKNFSKICTTFYSHHKWLFAALKDFSGFA